MLRQEQTGKVVSIQTDGKMESYWNFKKYWTKQFTLCLTPRTTVTSARIPDKDACHRKRNLGALSDVTVVLGMRQSIGKPSCDFPDWFP